MGYIQHKLFQLCLTIILAALLFLPACGQKPGMSPEPVPGIAFVSDRTGNWDIFLVQPDGSKLTQLTHSETLDGHPDFSPDGSQITFRSRRDGSSDIFIMGADGSSPVNLIKDPIDSFDDEFNPKWHPDGEQLAIYTDRFMGMYHTCDHTGHELALMPSSGGKEEIAYFDLLKGSAETYDWSPDGKSIVIGSICNQKAIQLYHVDITTREVIQLTDSDAGNLSPAFSPDGSLLAFTSSRDGNAEIYLMDLSTGEERNLTNHPAIDTHASWSPDGEWIAFTSDRDDNQEIYVLNILTGSLINVTQNAANDFHPSWSPIINIDKVDSK